MGVLGETAVKITADTSGFHAQASKGVLSSVTKIGASAAAIFGGLKLGQALFVDPIKKAGDFQKSLNVLWASTEHGSKTMKDVSNLAIKLGNDIKLPGVGASDAANAMLQLGKSGFNVAQSMDAVRGTLLLATAAETDGANAAKVVTQNINAFGLQAKDTSMIVDDMAGFMNATGTSFDAFTDSLSYVAAPAKAAGQSFGQTATQLAILSQNGIEGSMAGTGLRTILNGLSTDGSKASKAFKDIGISTVDAKGNFIGMRETIEKLEPVLAKMTSSERNKLMKEAFGVNSMNQAKILLGTLPEKYDKVNKTIEKQGSAQRLAAAQTKGFNGAVKNLQNAFENFQLVLGLKVLPKLTTFLKWLGKLAAAKDFNMAITIVWKGVAEMAGDLKVALKKAIFGGRSDDLFGTGAVRITSKSIAVDEGIADKIGAALAAQPWGKIGTQVGDSISKAIKVSGDALNGMLDSMLAWVNAHTGQFAEIGIIIGLKIVQKLLDPAFWAQHWQLIGGVILAVATTVFTPARFAGLGVKLAEGAFGLFGATAGKIILAGLEKLPGVVGSFAPKLAASFGKLIADSTTLAVAAMGRLIGEILAVVPRAFGKLGPLVKAALSTGIVAVIGNLIGVAVAKATQLASDVSKAILSIPGRIASLGSQVAASIGNAADHAAKAAANMGKRIVSGVLGALEGIGGKALAKITQITNEVNQVAQDAWAAAQRIGTRIVSGVLAGLTGLAGAVKDKIQGAISWGMSKLDIRGGSPLDTAGAHLIGIPLMESVIRGVESTKARLGASITTVVSDGMSRGAQAMGAATEQTTTIFDRWAENVKTRIQAVFDLAHAKIDAEYAKAQAKLDAWKASMTPTEALLASMQAQAALAAVDGAVASAKAALSKLDADFVASWNKLLADQQANMAKLKATQAVTETDEAIAGHEFSQTLAGASPLAVKALEARKALDTAKQLYAEHKISQDALFAAQDAWDAASLAAQETTDGAKLLQDYDTWQGLVKQTAEGNAGIVAQEAADATTRAEAIAGYDEARKTASQAVYDALLGQQTYYLEQQAKTERTAQDALYDIKDKALKKTYDRIDKALDNQEKLTLKKYDDMITDAKKAGKTMGDEFAGAIEDITKPGGDLEKALVKVGKLVAKYLKLNSPAEAGPLSDLDKWWKKLAPTLVASLDGSAIKGALSDAVTPSGGRFGPGSPGGAPGRQTLSLNDAALMQKLGELVDHLRANEGGSPVTVLATGGAQAAVIGARR